MWSLVWDIVQKTSDSEYERSEVHGTKGEEPLTE